MSKFKSFTNDSYLFTLLLFWGVVFIVLFTNMFEWRSDGLWVGHENVWSDWSLHLSLASIFAYKSPSLWFAYHPVYANGSLTYPFLANFISGMFMRAGLSIPAAFAIPSIACCILLIVGLYRFFGTIGLSARRAFLAVNLFFLASGMGFVQFIREFINQPSLSMLMYPPKQYSRLDDMQWYAGNFIVGQLIPQRAFLLGIVLAIWGLYFFLRAEQLPAQRARYRIYSALLIGVLPIAHMHSYIVVVMLLTFYLTPKYLLGLFKNTRQTLVDLKQLSLEFILLGAGLSLTLYKLLVSGKIEDPHFMSIKIWGFADGFFPWIKFWGWTWGIMLPFALFSTVLLYRKSRQNPAQRSHLYLYLGFWAVFDLTNIVQFQPIRWDNSKLQLWVYLGFCGLTAWAIGEIYFKFKNSARPRTANLVAGTLIFLLTATGTTEVLNLLNLDRHRYQLISKEEWDLADQVRLNTEPLARFATDTSHQHPIMLRGLRPIILGYTAWAFNYGFLYQDTEHDLKQIFAGGDSALGLIKKHKVSYVYIGPGERRNLSPNVPFFQASFPVAFQTSSITIFDVRKTL